MEKATLRVDELRLDLRNPRKPGAEFADTSEAVEYLIRYADVMELISSISRSGWLDFEPLIVERDTKTVIEGNRRLAALLLIRDPELRQAHRLTLPDAVHDGATPESVEVFLVGDRTEARDFIGFKHINGPFKWDALAKAKYAWEWLQEDPDLGIEAISERLGDRHSTVRRLVNAYTVLRQAEDLGFDRTDTTRGLTFSHLYTGLPYVSVRGYLGLGESASALLPADPVAPDRHDNLLRYMTWLFGQGDKQRVITSQNPDLGKLAKVLESKQATAMLEAGEPFAVVSGLVEDKKRGFEEAVYKLSTAASEAAGRLGGFDGDEEILSVATSAYRTVRRMVQAMQKPDDDDLGLKDSD
jgi:hypothetical protein